MYLHVISLTRTMEAGSMASMTDRAAGQDPRRLSRCVCNTLRMVTRTVTRLYDDALRPSGLRATQFSILATIAGKDEANLNQLAAALAIYETPLARRVNLLQRDGVRGPPDSVQHSGDHLR